MTIGWRWLAASFVGAAAFAWAAAPRSPAATPVDATVQAARALSRSAPAGTAELGPERDEGADGRAARRRARRFRTDVRAFAADLQRAADRYRGAHLGTTRARQLAYVAVSEAYRYDLPPALVFGVMRQENPWYEGHRTSHAGAVGLMQVMPGIWQGECGGRFGRDLRDDAMNLRCGIFVLAHYAGISRGAWRYTLWRYNGWGQQYPNRVRRHIEYRAPNLCPSGSFERCVSRPLHEAYGRPTLARR